MNQDSTKKLVNYYQLCMDRITKKVNQDALNVGEKFSKKELDTLFKEIYKKNTGFQIQTSKAPYDLLSDYVEFCISYSITKFNIPANTFDKKPII